MVDFGELRAYRGRHFVRTLQPEGLTDSREKSARAFMCYPHHPRSFWCYTGWKRYPTSVEKCSRDLTLVNVQKRIVWFPL